MSTELNPIVGRCVRMALFGGGAFAASVATHSSTALAAAATATTSDTSTTLEEVVVTGSRIATPGLDTISPITVVTAGEIANSGVTRIEDILNSLPQVVADQGSGLSMGSNGTATVNLRGLGAQRTLVLVNGRRLMGGDPGGIQGSAPGIASAADINQIPVALVEKIDVLTGGAASTYGADAVAGVVNFVMNDHFEGVRLDTNLAIYNHSNHQGWINPLLTAGGDTPVSGTNWDAPNQNITAIMGHNFADGAGNLEAYLGWNHAVNATASQRDFAACTLSDSTTSNFPYACGGSRNSAPAVWVGGPNGYNQITASGGVAPFYKTFNYAASHYLQREDTRWTAGFFGKMKFNDHAEAYTEFQFMNDQTAAFYAPGGDFFGGGPGVNPSTAAVGAGVGNGNFLVNCGVGAYGNAGMNPYLTSQEFGSICVPGANNTAQFLAADGTAQLRLARRNIEGGPREDNYGHETYRGVLGVRGEIVQDWNYDVYGLYANTNSSDYHANDTSAAKIQNALLAIRDPVTHQIVCAGGQAGCVPWNIWNPAIPITKDQVNYISVPGIFNATSTEYITEGFVAGDLTRQGIKTPWSDTGLKVVFGTQYRSETIQTQPDIEYLTGDLAGLGSPTPPVDAGYHVWEGYTEERMPIARDQTFAKALDFETGYRYSNYTVGYSTNTYKFGVEWQPVNDIRFRGSYNRAVRAPNLQELFQPVHVGLDGGGDGCATGQYSAAQCALTGLNPLNYPAIKSPAGQYNGQIGGNTALQPEKASTRVFGLIFTPSFLPNFSATFDWVDIKIQGLIQTYGPNLIQANCINSGVATSSWCQMIHRDPTGTLWAGQTSYTIDPLLNNGGEENKSYDVAMNYKVDMGQWGGVRTRLVGTYLADLLYSPNGGLSYNCAGLYGPSCAPATPKWRHVLLADWDTPITGFAVGMSWRYFAATVNSMTSPSVPPDYQPGYTPVDSRLPSISYFDLHASYVWNKATIRLGVNNVFDKDPPLLDTVSSGGNSVYAESNTYPSLYDTLGRYIFLNVTVDF
jgi:iron complex outermembrane recepter protein